MLEEWVDDSSEEDFGVFGTVKFFSKGNKILQDDH
jgi:hypothetical protein